MYWSKCPNAGNKAAMERAKVREAEFKEWKEKHGHKWDKKKTSFKSRVAKKIQAAITKALEDQANGTAAPGQGQAGAGAAQPLPAATQVTATQATTAAAGVAAGGQSPLPSVSFAAGPVDQGPRFLLQVPRRTFRQANLWQVWHLLRSLTT